MTLWRNFTNTDQITEIRLFTCSILRMIMMHSLETKLSSSWSILMKYRNTFFEFFIQVNLILSKYSEVTMQPCSYITFPSNLFDN